MTDFPTTPIRVIEGELDETTEIPFLRVLPPVPPAAPRPGPDSPRLAVLRRYGWLVGLIVAGLLCLIATRDQFVAWDGLHQIPTWGAR